jgi:hypothetical protein
MISAQRCPTGMLSSTLPPSSMKAPQAAAASFGRRPTSPAKTRLTAKRRSRRWRAATKASPPLLPGPARISSAAPCSDTARSRQVGSGQSGALHQRLLGSQRLDRRSSAAR